MKKIFISFFLYIGLTHSGFAQETDLKQFFLAAESYFLFEEFNEALPLYLRIHRQDPENDNVNFKIGICYLNDPFQKDKSISYLERAVKNINPKHKESSFKEKAAPLESLFYLGNAYRVNNKLDKAKEYYRLFLTKLDPEIFDIQIVEDQITACENAEKMMKKPIDFDSENLGNTINTRFSDQNAILSGDETKMAFISKLQFYDAVFFTEKVEGEWTTPRNIIPELGVDGDVYPTALSYNGTEMLIYRSDDFIGNIYTSKFVNGKWTPLVKLNENINTKYWESHASFSRDGKTLYFSSNRRGGFGGLDIYRSEREANGEWGIPVNLGPTINTKYNDDTPFITESGDKLYFSSYGHFNMGGYDIFMSRKKADGTWAEPVNIGYPINTTDDDQFFYPLKNGEIAYYSRYDSKEGFGRHDIFRYMLYTADNPRLFAIEGLLNYQGKQVNPEEIKISVVNPLIADTVKRLHPEINGSFAFKVPAGKYEMIFDSEKFHKKIVQLEVSPDSPREGLVLTNPIILEMRPPTLPVEELEKLLSIREDSIIYAKENEKVTIRYNAEKDSEVIIQVYNEGRLISTDTLNADRRRQSFEFKPLPGENEVKIIVTDQDGNSITKKVKVIAPSALPSVTSEDSIGEQTEVLGEGPESESGQVKRLTTLDEKIQALRENSSPELKEFLDKLDLEAEGVKSEKDLINHLFAASDKEGFSRDQLIDALSRSGLLSDLDIFIRDLAGFSSPGLQKYLLELNTAEEGITNENELIRHLFENAGENTYPRQDVVDALNKLNASREMKILIDELKNHTQGALLEYLSTLDPDVDSIYSLEDLQNHLMEIAATSGFTKDDVMNMFQSYFDENQYSTKNILEKMIKIAENENLEFLKSFRESWNETMNNRQNFYDNLFESIEKQGLKTEDIVSLALEAENVSLQNLKDHMLRYGSPDLQNAVKDHPASLGTGKKLYDYLSKLSVEDKSVDQKEVTDLAKDYLSKKDLYDLYYSLIRNSDGKLREYLQSLDIKNSGINSAADLIKHLFNVSSDQGFSHDDIYNALNKANAEAYINQMISDLIQLAEGNIKTSLEALNPDVEGIQSLQDIITYLLNNRERFGYNEQDVYDLIRKYLSLDTDITGSSEYPADSLPAVKEKFSRGVKLTAGILLLEGLLILILILLARRKRKKDKNA